MASGPSSGMNSATQNPQQGEQYADNPRTNPHLAEPRAPRLTPEEISVLRECTQESFYYRCIPLATAFGAGAAYLFKTGYLKPHPRFGNVPKIAGAIFAAYVLGKVSYQNECQQKILAKIPNSNLAQSVRKSKGMETVYSSELSSDAGPELGFTQQSKIRDNFSSIDQTTNPNLSSSDRKELDDNFRPTLDREVKVKEEAAPALQPSQTYDDLRRQNRQEYERSVATSPDSPFRQKPFPAPAPPSSAAPPPPPSNQRTPRSPTGVKRNEYGDIVES